MSKYVQQMIQAVLEGNLKKSEAMLKRGVELRFEAMVKEDHEKSMSEEELKHYIKDLHSKAKDEHKEAFAKHLEADECNDEAFSKAAAKHCTSKVKADHLIHKLEKLVGSKIDPKEYKQDKKKGETDSEAEKESKMKKGQVKESERPFDPTDNNEDENWAESTDKLNDIEKEKNDSVYKRMKDAGVEIAHHESDLYVPINDTTTAILRQAKQDGLLKSKVETFRDSVTNTMYYDIPFMYAPFKWTRGSDVNESTNEYEAQTYNHWVGHSKGKRTIFPHPKGKIPTQDTHPEHDEGIAGPYKTKKEAFNAAQGKNKVKESDEIKQDVLNELNASTLARYIGKASVDKGDKDFRAGIKLGQGNAKDFNKDNEKPLKRLRGIMNAAYKLKRKANKAENE